MLDVGAGAGLLGEYLRDEFPRAAYCFDEPIASLQSALEQRHGTERNWTGRRDWMGVDFVTLLDVLEHQPDDRAFLGTLFERMPPGARLILTVPALQSLWSSWDAQLGHVRRYDRTSLSNVIAQFPFEVRELTYLFPELLAPAIARRFGRGPTGREEFPVLPKALNASLTALGSVSLKLRQFMPLGTSLLAVVDKP